jgi:chloramphenicol-sensitive protein RarD
VLPVYWKLLAAVPAHEILAHRIVWSVPLLAGWLAVRGRGGELRAALAAPRVLAVLAITTLLIAGNWWIYIWAVNSGRIVEASLGYFINPLVSVLLGVLFLRERLGRRRVLALALAAAGVAVLTLRLGRLPWVAFALALSFGLYGLLRKQVRAEAETGLLVETAFLWPFALGFLWLREAAGEAAFGHTGTGGGVLLAATGVVTVLPLVWFTRGARRLPLATIGFLQYLAPTLQFLLGVAVYREPFTAGHLAAFALIWAGLAVFTVDLRARAREGKPVAAR